MSAVDWLLEADFTQQDVDEAILAVFQKVSEWTNETEIIFQ